MLTASSHATKDIYVRQAQGSRSALKEKFVEIYGALFRVCVTIVQLICDDYLVRNPTLRNRRGPFKAKSAVLGRRLPAQSERALPQRMHPIDI
ncbi:hypothetical protein BC938DRAFT_479675 [Jimgerdemannia flammicorona]|uniref:Uncharacterized protein n=1 Tax=Jimgerdemannia flammicorona TaxID=994334 RepID=A0A433QXN3_9FUNG|nr:hypothetical protein BC938DRAFT_479675 [Jimgerdemannia flammicorona]